MSFAARFKKQKDEKLYAIPLFKKQTNLAVLKRAAAKRAPNAKLLWLKTSISTAAVEDFH